MAQPMGLFYAATRPLLFCLDSERAHDLALRAARIGGAPFGKLCGGRAPTGKPVEVAGLKLRNPVGLAAGFDKNGVALPFWRALGFGFVEFGTVTPRPQPGNDKPRMWRFPDRRALGNRMGFPNDGAAAVAARLKRSRLADDVVGINLGKNKATPNEKAADDYVAALEMTAGVADYFVVNVSSPNTPGLRELQSRGYLTDLLGRVREAAGSTPVFVKLSPDLDDGGLCDAAAAVLESGCTGTIATNTTLARPEGVEFEGGLSGRPLAERSRDVLRKLRELTGDLPIVSVGGIDSAEEARARLDAGASLVQVYSAMIFEGPGLPARLVRGLS
jgi:dihydroorotate dehydrogenase